jgi:hypothetical protein
MLTLRMIQPTGHEEIITVRRVSIQPPEPPHPGDSNDITRTDSLFYELENGEVLHTITGTVYVMNDYGKTVAVYHLQYPPPNTIPLDENNI